VNLHLGFKNSVFKAKVIFKIFVKSDEIFKRFQWTACNPGSLVEIPQMIYLQKESRKSIKKSISGQRKPKSQFYKVLKINFRKWV